MRSLIFSLFSLVLAGSVAGQNATTPPGPPPKRIPINITNCTSPTEQGSMLSVNYVASLTNGTWIDSSQ